MSFRCFTRHMTREYRPVLQLFLGLGCVKGVTGNLASPSSNLRGKIRINKPLRRTFREKITPSWKGENYKKETQNNPALILFNVKWDRENLGQDFKIMLFYLTKIKSVTGIAAMSLSWSGLPGRADSPDKPRTVVKISNYTVAHYDAGPSSLVFNFLLWGAWSNTQWISW